MGHFSAAYLKQQIHTLSGWALTVLPWPLDKPGAIHLIFSLLFSLEFLCVQAPCLLSSQLVLPGNSWWMFPRSKLKGGLRERRTNLNGQKCNGERWQKEMLNKCTSSVSYHNHACASSSVDCETLQAMQIQWYTRLFSNKQGWREFQQSGTLWTS